jgi:hypothetical protein
LNVEKINSRNIPLKIQTLKKEKEEMKDLGKNQKIKEKKD